MTCFCGNPFDSEWAALSRVDNVKICPTCGNREAMLSLRLRSEGESNNIIKEALLSLRRRSS
jgi:hypothetical protein